MVTPIRAAGFSLRARGLKPTALSEADSVPQVPNSPSHYLQVY